MRGDTLLDFAKAGIVAADMLSQLVDTGDEIYTNIVAFHVQQAIENALKHVLEMEGVGFRKGHGTEEYLKLMGGGVLTEELFNALLYVSSALDSMGEKSRCVKNYRAPIEVVARSRKLFAQLLLEIEGRYS